MLRTAPASAQRLDAPACGPRPRTRRHALLPTCDGAASQPGALPHAPPPLSRRQACKLAAAAALAASALPSRAAPAAEAPTSLPDITQRVFLDFGVCPGIVRAERALGASAACDSAQQAAAPSALHIATMCTSVVRGAHPARARRRRRVVRPAGALGTRRHWLVRRRRAAGACRRRRAACPADCTCPVCSLRDGQHFAPSARRRSPTS